MSCVDRAAEATLFCIATLNKAAYQSTTSPSKSENERLPVNHALISQKCEHNTFLAVTSSNPFIAKLDAQTPL